MKEYLRRSKPLRGDSTKLFISFMKPHKHISRESLSRWIKTVMEAAGIDTSICGLAPLHLNVRLVGQVIIGDLL